MRPGFLTDLFEVPCLAGSVWMSGSSDKSKPEGAPIRKVTVSEGSD
jgi:hypothetical protein